MVSAPVSRRLFKYSSASRIKGRSPLSLYSEIDATLRSLIPDDRISYSASCTDSGLRSGAGTCISKRLHTTAQLPSVGRFYPGFCTTVSGMRSTCLCDFRKELKDILQLIVIVPRSFEAIMRLLGFPALMPN